MIYVGSSTVIAALSGKDTFLIVAGVVAILIFVLRWKYAPPWWLRGRRENKQEDQHDETTSR